VGFFNFFIAALCVYIHDDDDDEGFYICCQPPEFRGCSPTRKRSGLCSRDLRAIAELVDCAHDVLFNKVLDNPYHVLHNSVPNETVSNYALRSRPHNRELVNKINRFVESSFIVRMLYKDLLDYY